MTQMMSATVPASIATVLAQAESLETMVGIIDAIFLLFILGQLVGFEPTDPTDCRYNSTM